MLALLILGAAKTFDRADHYDGLCPAIAAFDRFKGCEVNADIQIQKELCPPVNAVSRTCKGASAGRIPNEVTDWEGWQALGNIGFDIGFGRATMSRELCHYFNDISKKCESKSGIVTANPKEICDAMKPVVGRHWASMTQIYGTFCHAPRVLHVTQGEWSGFSYSQWSMVYNVLSFGIAGMGSGTIFFWLMISNVAPAFKPALAITGIVTFIATYHYFRIFNSWCDGFEVVYSGTFKEFIVLSSGLPFNDAYRYVDWLLTVPLLLIELILVMQLPSSEAYGKMWKLGVSSALMVSFGYPGELRDDPGARWFYWACAMVPFMYVLYELYFGLAEATTKQAPSVASLTASARYLTAISWLTYPFVYMIKGVGLGGPTATALEQVGYSIADVIAKAVFGVVIWGIAHAKSRLMEEEGLLSGK